MTNRAPLTKEKSYGKKIREFMTPRGPGRAYLGGARWHRARVTVRIQFCGHYGYAITWDKCVEVRLKSQKFAQVVLP